MVLRVQKMDSVALFLLVICVVSSITAPIDDYQSSTILHKSVIKPEDDSSPNQAAEWNLQNEKNIIELEKYGVKQLSNSTMPKGIWDFVGDWIQGSDWFPVQVNIPDIFQNIGNGFNSFTSGIIQRIPFLNRPPGTKPFTMLFPIRRRNLTKFADGNVPLMVILPVKEVDHGQKTGMEDFIPFEDIEEAIPYP